MIIQLRTDTVGDLIKTARLYRKLNQRQLALLVGAPFENVCRWEKNRQAVRSDLLLKLLNHLDLAIQLKDLNPSFKSEQQQSEFPQKYLRVINAYIARYGQDPKGIVVGYQAYFELCKVCGDQLWPDTIAGYSVLIDPKHPDRITPLPEGLP